MIEVDKFQWRKENNSEAYMQKFMDATGMVHADKDFYVQFEAYLEAQYVKESIASNKEDKPQELRPGDIVKTPPAQGVMMYETNEEAYVLISKDKNNFIQGVVVGGKFFVATRKELTNDYLFELVEQGVITAQQAKDMKVSIN